MQSSSKIITGSRNRQNFYSHGWVSPFPDHPLSFLQCRSTSIPNLSVSQSADPGASFPSTLVVDFAVPDPVTVRVFFLALLCQRRSK